MLRVVILEEERPLMGLVVAWTAIKNGRRESKTPVESMADRKERGMSRWGRRCCYQFPLALDLLSNEKTEAIQIDICLVGVLCVDCFGTARESRQFHLTRRRFRPWPKRKLPDATVSNKQFIDRTDVAGRTSSCCDEEGTDRSMKRTSRQDFDQADL